jgi:hypothetical protein
MYRGIPEIRKPSAEINVHIMKFDQELVDSGVARMPMAIAIGAEM